MLRLLPLLGVGQEMLLDVLLDALGQGTIAVASDDVGVHAEDCNQSNHHDDSSKQSFHLRPPLGSVKLQTC